MTVQLCSDLNDNQCANSATGNFAFWPTNDIVNCGVFGGNSSPSIKIQIIRTPIDDSRNGIIGGSAYSNLVAQTMDDYKRGLSIGGIVFYDSLANTNIETLPAGTWNYTCLAYSPSNNATIGGYSQQNIQIQPLVFYGVTDTKSIPQQGYLTISPGGFVAPTITNALYGHEDSQSKQNGNIYNESYTFGYLAGNIIVPGNGYAVTRTFQKWNLTFLNNASQILAARVRYWNGFQPFLNNASFQYSQYINTSTNSYSQIFAYGMSEGASNSWNGHTTSPICGEVDGTGVVSSPGVFYGVCSSIPSGTAMTRRFGQNINNFQTEPDFTLDVTPEAQQALTTDSKTFGIVLTNLGTEGANIGDGNALAVPNGIAVPLNCVDNPNNAFCSSELEIYYSVGNSPTKIDERVSMSFTPGFSFLQGIQSTISCHISFGDPNVALVLQRNGTTVASGFPAIQTISETATLSAGNWNYTCFAPGTTTSNFASDTEIVSVGTPTYCSYTGTSCINNQVWNCQNNIPSLIQDCGKIPSICNTVILSINSKSASCFSINGTAGPPANTTAGPPLPVQSFAVGFINLMTSLPGFILLTMTFMTAMVYRFMNEEITLYINTALFFIFGAISFIPSWAGIMAAVFSVTLVILTQDKKKN